MYDIIVIGAGPAGLTAGIFARRASKKVLILEDKACGGLILQAAKIENYPACPNISGTEYALNLYNQTKELGAEFKFERAIDIKDLGNYKEVVTNNNTYQGKTVILATGSENRKLGLPMEDELVGKGVSYCATCDGMFFRGKDVAVVGGGDTAIDDARYLSNIANKVYLIHRRDTFKAEVEEVNEIKEKNNIEFILNSNVVKLNTTNDLLSSIEVKNNDGDIKEINVSGIFIAVGRIPENQNFAKLINLDKNGYIIAGEDCHTNIDGIFVAGDNRVKELRQLVTASSDGAIAATEAIKYMNKKD